MKSEKDIKSYLIDVGIEVDIDFGIERQDSFKFKTFLSSILA